MAADAASQPAYRRIVLKLSGEALAGSQGYGVDPAVLVRIGAEVREVIDLGVQVAIVIGGGNIFRGLAARPRKMLPPPMTIATCTPRSMTSRTSAPIRTSTAGSTP